MAMYKESVSHSKPRNFFDQQTPTNSRNKIVIFLIWRIHRQKKQFEAEIKNNFFLNKCTSNRVSVIGFKELNKGLLIACTTFSWSRYSTVLCFSLFVIVLPYAEFPQSLNVSARIFFEESMSPVLLASET